MPGSDRFWWGLLFLLSKSTPSPFDLDCNGLGLEFDNYGSVEEGMTKCQKSVDKMCGICLG